ncbi:MAG TPA: hypothetical protein VG265_05835 [Gaiellaceae bacterium]|jgi:hypothetical protein|nr:hypothetical protein [Gaiellaceae bacterium]
MKRRRIDGNNDVGRLYEKGDPAFVADVDQRLAQALDILRDPATKGWLVVGMRELPYDVTAIPHAATLDGKVGSVLDMLVGAHQIVFDIATDFGIREELIERLDEDAR